MESKSSSSSSEKKEGSSSSEKSTGDTVSEDTIKVKAEKASQAGKGAIEDTARLVPAGKMAVITDVEDVAIITVAKGNKLSWPGDEKSFMSSDKKQVSINTKGLIKAKKMTYSPVEIKYSQSGKAKTLYVNVIDPSVSGNAVIKKLTASASAGTQLDLTLKIPLNLVKGATKVKGGITDLSIDIADDGRWHLKGKCDSKGSATIPLIVNGKKFNFKVKVK